MEAAATEAMEAGETEATPRRRGRPPGSSKKTAAARRGRPAKTVAPSLAVVADDDEPAGDLLSEVWAPLSLEALGYDPASLYRIIGSGDVRASHFAVFILRAAQIGPIRALAEVREMK